MSKDPSVKPTPSFLADVILVFGVELKNTIRDRRTWIAMIIVPLLVVPLLLVAAPSAVEKMTRDVQEKPSNIALIGAQNSPFLADFLTQSASIRIVQVDDYEAALSNNEIEAALVIPEGFDEKLAMEKPAQLALYYDAADQRSSIVRTKLENILAQLENKLLSERLQARGLSREILEVINLQSVNVAPEEKVAGLFLSMVMPMLLLTWGAVGGMYAAIDAMAGEKERGTLQPLLATPPSRSAIILGKYLTVLLSSLVAVTVAVLGMYAAVRIKPAALLGPEAAGAAPSYGLPVTSALLIMLSTLFISGIFAGIELAASAFARSFKEAQTYLTPVTIVVVLPGILTQMVSPQDVASHIYLLPLVNALFLFKELLQGTVNPAHLLMTLGSSLVYTIISVRLAVALLQKETVLFRT